MSFTVFESLYTCGRHVHCFELSKCSKRHRVLPGIAMVHCDYQFPETSDAMSMVDF
jgi:hypothetical protein